MTTDVRPFRFTGDPVAHECDATAVDTGSSTVPVPTRGAAITAASQLAPFTMTGTFSAQFGSPTFETVAGQSVAFDPATGKFLAEYKNGVSASVGSCADPISSGDDVVFGYGTSDRPRARAQADRARDRGAGRGRVVVRVTNEADGAPLAGRRRSRAGASARRRHDQPRAVHGPRAACGQGHAQRRHPLQPRDVLRHRRRRRRLRDDGAGAGRRPPRRASPPATTASAERPTGALRWRGSSRSTSAAVPPPPRAARCCAATVAADPSGIAGIRLRLTRRFGGRCSTFAGAQGPLRAHARLRRRPRPLVPDRHRRAVVYLLPRRLGPRALRARRRGARPRGQPRHRSCAGARAPSPWCCARREAGGRHRGRCWPSRSRAAAWARGPGPTAPRLTSRATSASAPLRDLRSPQVRRAARRSCGCCSATRGSRRASAAASCSRSTASPAARSGGRPVDWFYYVNGVEAPRGAAATRAALGRPRLVGPPRLDGDADACRPWSARSPSRSCHGIDGKRLPVRVECAPPGSDACGARLAGARVVRHPRRDRQPAERARRSSAARARRAVERAARATRRSASSSAGPPPAASTRARPPTGARSPRSTPAATPCARSGRGPAWSPPPGAATTSRRGW